MRSARATRPRIARLSHLTLETPDIERQVDHARHVLGLTLVARDGPRAFLANSRGAFCLVLQAGDTARCAKMTFEADTGTDLRDIEAVRAEAVLHPTRPMDPEPLRSRCRCRSRRARRRRGPRLQPCGPPGKLEHVAFNVADVQHTVDFDVRTLGFRISDRPRGFFAFLRRSPDHHALDLLVGTRNKMHHMAFALDVFDHVKQACDHLARHRLPLIRGPVRHGVGHRISIYYRDPDGQIGAFLTEMDVMIEEVGHYVPRPWHDDRPQKPKIWGAGNAHLEHAGRPYSERLLRSAWRDAAIASRRPGVGINGRLDRHGPRRRES